MMRTASAISVGWHGRIDGGIEPHWREKPFGRDAGYRRRNAVSSMPLRL